MGVYFSDGRLTGVTPVAWFVGAVYDCLDLCLMVARCLQPLSAGNKQANKGRDKEPVHQESKGKGTPTPSIVACVLAPNTATPNHLGDWADEHVTFHLYNEAVEGGVRETEAGRFLEVLPFLEGL